MCKGLLPGESMWQWSLYLYSGDTRLGVCRDNQLFCPRIFVVLLSLSNRMSWNRHDRFLPTRYSLSTSHLINSWTKNRGHIPYSASIAKVYSCVCACNYAMITVQLTNGMQSSAEFCSFFWQNKAKEGRWIMRYQLWTHNVQVWKSIQVCENCYISFLSED
jgi:hypothetical protein